MLRLLIFFNFLFSISLMANPAPLWEQYLSAKLHLRTDDTLISAIHEAGKNGDFLEPKNLQRARELLAIAVQKSKQETNGPSFRHPITETLIRLGERHFQNEGLSKELSAHLIKNCDLRILMAIHSHNQSAKATLASEINEAFSSAVMSAGNSKSSFQHMSLFLLYRNVRNFPDDYSPEVRRITFENYNKLLQRLDQNALERHLDSVAIHLSDISQSPDGYFNNDPAITRTLLEKGIVFSRTNTGVNLLPGGVAHSCLLALQKALSKLGISRPRTTPVPR